MIDRRVLMLCLLMAIGSLGACSSHSAQSGPGEQIKFGVSMARQGLWSEALFRFEQANRMEPRNAEVLNNIAVAYEAVGKFDEALSAYQEAIAIAPGNRDLRCNYSRFVEFYQSFKPPTAEGDAAVDTSAQAADSTGSSD